MTEASSRKLPRNIIVGQPVSEGKLELAKSMRRKMTPAEKKLWQCVRGNQVMGFHFRRQQVIHGFIADFYCHQAGLVVEVDGDGHDVEYDADRDRVMKDLGMHVLRFRNEQVLQNIQGVLEEIRGYLRSIDLTPCPPSRHGKGEPAPG